MQGNMEELRSYYDNTDIGKQMIDAEWDYETDDHPMIGITVRLPREVLQRVRELAAEEGVKTTALIRQWVEAAVVSSSRPSEPPHRVRSKADAGEWSAFKLPISGLVAKDIELFARAGRGGSRSSTAHPQRRKRVKL